MRAVEYACSRVMSQLPPLAVDPATELPSVLVVEEHDEMRSALRDWLLTSFPPLRLREARSMQEALTLAEQAQLDLILVNLELPGPNGIEAARALRRRHPACRVVVMSVNDSVALRIAALEAGAEAFVSKRDLRMALHPILATLMKQKI
jgi:DNA-binding NarL/FixJ family response regulator